MKRVFFVIVAVIITAGLKAQAVKEIVLPNTSANLNVVLQNPNITPVPTYTWTENGNSGFVSTDLSTLTTGSVTVQLKNTVVAGNEAKLSVSASAGSCPGNSYDVTLRVVGSASYSVTSGAVQGTICQNGTATINFTFNNSIVKFTYFIDLDKDGQLSGTEAYESATVNNSSYTLVTNNLTTAGTYPIIVTAVTGNDGTNNITSPSNYSVSLPVNEKPVIIDIF